MVLTPLVVHSWARVAEAIFVVCGAGEIGVVELLMFELLSRLEVKKSVPEVLLWSETHLFTK